MYFESICFAIILVIMVVCLFIFMFRGKIYVRDVELEYSEKNITKEIVSNISFKYEWEKVTDGFYYLKVIVKNSNGKIVRNEYVKTTYKIWTGKYGFKKPELKKLAMIVDKDYNKDDNEFTQFIQKYDTLEKYLEYKDEVLERYNEWIAQYKDEVKEFELKNNL